AERDIDRREDLLEVLGFGGPYDRRRYPRCLQNPGAGDLSWRHPPAFSHLFHRGGDRKVVLAEVRPVSKLISLCPLSRRCPACGLTVSREEAARQRAPGN